MNTRMPLNVTPCAKHCHRNTSCRSDNRFSPVNGNVHVAIHSIHSLIPTYLTLSGICLDMCLCLFLLGRLCDPPQPWNLDGSRHSGSLIGAGREYVIRTVLVCYFQWLPFWLPLCQLGTSERGYNRPRREGGGAVTNYLRYVWLSDSN